MLGRSILARLLLACDRVCCAEVSVACAAVTYIIEQE